MAIQLGDLKEAHKLAVEAQSEHKWKQLAELATAKSEFVLAQECLHRAQDFGGLLLLATSSGKIFKICLYFKNVRSIFIFHSLGIFFDKFHFFLVGHIYI